MLELYAPFYAHDRMTATTYLNTRSASASSGNEGAAPLDDPPVGETSNR